MTENKAPPIPARVDSLTTESLEESVSRTGAVEANLSEDNLTSSTSSPDVSSMEFVNTEIWKDSFTAIGDFYSNTELCDVEIKCGDGSFRCHRLVLACVSGYFRTMFIGNMAESRQDVVQIQDVDSSVLESMIKYCYTGKISLTTENVQSFLYTASILQIEKVARACSDFMKEYLDTSNCVDAHTFAEQHNRTELIVYTKDYIAENFTEVTSSMSFTAMPFKLLDALLDTSHLNVSSEKEVFEAVMAWIEADVESRKMHLSSLISKVKLPLIDTKYLMDKVATNSLIRSNMDCRDFLDEAKSYHMWLGDLVPDMKLTPRTRPRKSYAGVLFCVGGRGAAGDPYKSIECYNPLQDKWFHVTDMLTRRRHVGVCSFEGNVYAVGGHNGRHHLKSGEVFVPETGKWKKIPLMITSKTGVRGLGLACLGGAIYAVGGLDDKECFNTVERYDPVSKVWTPVASMNYHRGGVGLAALKGFLYAVGGNDGTASLNKCERYDPYVNKWEEVTSMESRRAGAGVGVLNGCIYAVGGFDDSASLNTCEQYNPKVNQWTSVAHMSCARGGVGVASLGGLLYAVGGHDGSNYLSTVESYDPLKDTWEAVSSTIQKRAGAGLTSSGCPPGLIHQLCSSQATSLREACSVTL